MFRSVFGSLSGMKTWIDSLAGRMNRKPKRSRQACASRRNHLMSLEHLEDRITPSNVMIVSSFEDSSLYEISATNGAVVKTLIKAYSSKAFVGPSGLTFGPDGKL